MRNMFLEETAKLHVGSRIETRNHLVILLHHSKTNPMIKKNLKFELKKKEFIALKFET